jgi:hypothetical protein
MANNGKLPCFGGNLPCTEVPQAIADGLGFMEVAYFEYFASTG